MFTAPSATWGSCVSSADGTDVVLTAPPCNGKYVDRASDVADLAWLPPAAVGEHECVALISIPMLKSKEFQGQRVDAVAPSSGKAEAASEQAADERGAPDQSGHAGVSSSPNDATPSLAASSDVCVGVASESTLGSLGRWAECGPSHATPHPHTHTRRRTHTRTHTNHLGVTCHRPIPARIHLPLGIQPRMDAVGRT
jgi:hypothetical protein